MKYLLFKGLIYLLINNQLFASSSALVKEEIEPTKTAVVSTIKQKERSDGLQVVEEGLIVLGIVNTVLVINEVFCCTKEYWNTALAQSLDPNQSLEGFKRQTINRGIGFALSFFALVGLIELGKYCYRHYSIKKQNKKLENSPESSLQNSLAM